MTNRPIPARNADTPEVVLDIRDLRIGYGGRPVLEGVHLDVCRGEFWFLVGPNGHGKTTLLKALLGMMRPDAGRIALRGEFGRPDRIGFVPQQFSISPTLPTTVREFVGLGLVGIRAGRADRHDRLRWALQQVELNGMEGRDLSSLSGGQRQRALVARALIRRPALLVADEATSGLDISVEAALYEVLAQLNRSEQLTAILVTHDVGIAARYGTHLAVVHHGRVDAGRTQAILDAGVLGEAYGFPIDVSADAAGSISVRLGARGPA